MTGPDDVDTKDRVEELPTAPDGLRVERGVCSVFFAFDIGFGIDLDRAERMLEVTKARELLQHRRRAPRYFQYQPAPLRITLAVDPVPIREVCTGDQLTAVLHDFGAISLTYQIPLAGSLADLLALGEALYEHEGLEKAAWDQARHILSLVEGAVERPGLSRAMEDYAVFHLAAFDEPVMPAEFLRDHRQEIAQLLRSEQIPLSDQEVDDAFSVHVSFSNDDVVLIDWNAALVLDPDPGDVLPVLEHANVQLVEMRHLDNELDDALEESYQVLKRPFPRHRAVFGGVGADVRKIGRLQVDGAIMFEAAGNALKLLGDQYMARLYRAVSDRFHLRDWEASIRQKLAALDSIYSKISDQNTTLRLEILEWIIIILIAVSIVIEVVAVFG